MDYKLIHDNIINRAKNRDTIEGYFEKHHILPKSLGGNNSKNNIVILTAKEHYLIHYLLTKLYPCNSMIYAFWMMCNGSRKKRPSTNSRMYETARKMFSEINSKRASYMKGKFHTEETKKKISESKKGQDFWTGRKHTEESKKKQSVSAKNRDWSGDNINEIKRREKISISHKNLEFSESHKKNISIAKMGDKNPMFGKRGKEHHNSKKVGQYLNDTLIKVWDSLSDIERCFNLKRGRLYSILKSKKKIYKEFTWNYIP